MPWGRGLAQIIPSIDVKVAGILGPAAPVLDKEKRSTAAADTVIGMGGTTKWRLAGLDACTTLAAFFEVKICSVVSVVAHMTARHMQSTIRSRHDEGF